MDKLIKARTTELRKERNRFAALAFVWGDLLLELDGDLRIVFASGASDGILGHGPQDLSGKSFIQFLAKQYRPLVTEMLRVARRRGRMDNIQVRFNQQADMLSPPVSMSGYFLPDLGDHFFVALRVAINALSPDVAASLQRDTATGLLDEESLSKVVTERLMARRETGIEHKFTLMTLNAFDPLCARMKQIEQAEMMASVGAFLRAHSVAGDTAGRLGTEQFGMLHRADVPIGDLEKRIEECVRDADPTGVGIEVSSSVTDFTAELIPPGDLARGVLYSIRRFCDRQEHSFTFSRLMGQADNLVNNTFSAMQDFGTRVDQLKFDTVYQPIVRLPNAEIHHFEVLVRFYDDDGKLIPTQELVSFAEQVNMVHRLDLAMLRRNLKWITSQLDQGITARVAVNISGHSLGNPDFCRSVIALFERHREALGQLMLEITETAEISDIDTAAKWIARFREFGVEICLDDFGTGASNFRYLSAMDIDYVKIDGESIRQSTKTAKGLAFLRSLVDLCHDINVEVVAEMIETDKMRELVTKAGFDYAQGYLFGKPEADITLYWRDSVYKR
ncbi:EAL domain-containing protein [Thalassospira tepidiphila]|uniref:Diguanylate phosphodiesterase n=2 Tax=Thalassospira tepidiphila TaxID=393657 RepID=A0A853L2L0_9PROT|nr:EAL domain-containing protein [Thalassospira tepidiphila]NJB72973.1 EAL domain-containing protein (putative c-di-GMP-specific phosphodiesterase class I)/GGDEF domain-containing protein [Thalassospira tepidiphila]OAZ11292.1 diguanylate phosphodiesterase [Thalassospira tepidiphila MCCC 1A03514]